MASLYLWLGVKAKFSSKPTWSHASGGCWCLLSTALKNPMEIKEPSKVVSGLCIVQIRYLKSTQKSFPK